MSFRELVIGVVAGALLIGASQIIPLSLHSSVMANPPVHEQDAPPSGEHRGQDLGMMLVRSLEASPGCLGVETAHTDSGKDVIFAWFKDKQAAVTWYNSGMHQGIAKRFFPDREPHIPLEHVADDSGPVLTIASITQAATPPPSGATTLPVSQIAIELYTTLPGGFAVGGRFAPVDVQVEHLISEAFDGQ
ncbi:MAG: hypothetical protein ACR2GY_03435 [Phycisphaerales bacterium]